MPRKKERTPSDKINNTCNLVSMAVQYPDSVSKTDIIPDYPELIKLAHEALTELQAMRYIIRDAIDLDEPAKFSARHYLTKGDLQSELDRFED